MAVLSILLVILPLVTQPVVSAPPLQVRTRQGVYQGVVASGGVERWLGIPYARPPLGELRFQAPQPVTRRFPGVQIASTFGNACPQPQSSSLRAPVDEDCLVLNVLTLCH